MLGIKHGYRTAKNCVPIRVTRLKNCVYIVVPTHIETVCLLSNRKLKPDTYIKLSLDMEDYYRIKDAEKEKNKTS